MAQYKINFPHPSARLWRILVAAGCLFAAGCFTAAGCASIQAAAAPESPPIAQMAVTRTSEPANQATFTPLVLPSDTPMPSATATLTTTPTLTPTETPSPTPTPTLTPTPVLIPALGSIHTISLTNLDALDRLAALAPDGGPESPIAALTFSPDGRWLALAEDSSIRLWDLRAGQPAASLSADSANFAGPLAFHPNSRQLSAVDTGGQVWSWTLPAEGGEPAPGPAFAPAGVDQLAQLAYSVDGSRLVGTGSRDGQGLLLLWETKTGNRLVEKPTGSSTSGSLLISPNGAWIVQAGQEGILRFWAPASGKPLGQQMIYACPDSLLSAAFSNDGAILALQCDGETDQIFLDAPNYYSPGDRWLAGLLEDPAPGPGLLAFNRDGALLAAAAGSPPRQVQLWNLIDKTPARALAGFGADIRQLAFSPDGKWLAVRLENGSVELWGVSK